jgi:putative colanic acid biosynthesis acetyltransferase WcaF
MVRAFLYRPSPVICHAWRRLLLRCFGAKIAKGARIYPSTRVWAPWNLTMGEGSVLGPDVDCYCVAAIVLERKAIVSQYAYLCGASHDYTVPDFTLLVGSIRVGQNAWVAAGAFVSPGVTIGSGAVVGARAVVTKDVEPWTVVAGNPARLIRTRPGTTEVLQPAAGQACP